MSQGTDSDSPKRKRARLESQDDNSLACFLEWCRVNDIYIDSRLEISHQAGTLSVLAKESIPAGQVVTTVPKSAILSTRTSALASHLPPPDARRVSSATGLDLALCLLYEQVLDGQSQFAAYLKTLPPHGVNLPLLRNRFPKNDDWAWIEGTEANRIDARASECFQRTRKGSWPYTEDYGICHDRLASYFDSFGLPLLRKAGVPSSKDLEDAFIRAYTLVSSRDFIVDIYHGLALVPVSDLFNHTDSHTIHFETNDNVCLECGVLFCRTHQEDPSEPDSDEEPDTVDMRTLQPIDASDEIFNTYGPLSNAYLLVRYGFCLEMETAMERITWDPRFQADELELESLHIPEVLASLQVPKSLSPSQRLAALCNLDFESTDSLEDYFVHLAVSVGEDDGSILTASEEELARADKTQALFLDGEGSVSFPLWRFCVLSQIDLKDKDVRREVQRIEALLSILLEETDPKVDGRDVQILRTSLGSLRLLIRARLDGLGLAKDEQQALDLIETAPAGSTLRGCLLHAYQEFAALRVADGKLEQLESILPKT